MKKSQKTRALVAAGCIAGSACVSGPMSRPPPPREDCPPGASETHERVGLSPGRTWLSFIPGRDPAYHPWLTLSEGDVTVAVMADFEGLPSETPLYGKLYFGNGRVYGRFTSARLKGEVVPICMQLIGVGEEGTGIKMEPGSTPTKVIIANRLYFRVEDRFR